MNSAPTPAGVSMTDLMGALRRRRWPALGAFVALLAAALAAAALWPASYRSVGTILIEQQELPTDLVQSTITSFADQRIQVIGQRVMTTDNLLRVVNRYNLYPDLRNKPREALLAQMRKDIRLQMISADVIDPRQGHATKANIAFAVSFDSRSPDTAAKVANEIISLYLDENVRVRRQQSADAETFLDDQAKALDENIARLEGEVAGFKNRHLNMLPDQTLVNREMLVRAQDDLRDIDSQAHVLEQQGTFLDSQLAQLAPNSQIFTSTGERVMSPSDRLKYLRSEYSRLSGLYSADHPDVVRIKEQIDGLEKESVSADSTNDLQRELLDARTRLAELQKKYAPDHPDVIRLQRQVATLSDAIRNTPAATSRGEADHADNPAYIQLKAQLEVNKSQQQALVERRENLAAKVASLEDRVAAAPGVEREYSDLARDLENEQIKYREVRQKQMAAKLSQNLEDQQKGERFTLIDPPLVPQEPTSPNRKLLVGMGIIVAIVASVLVVMLLERGDGTIRSSRELEALLEVPPLAILPLMETLADRALLRRQRRLALAGTAGAFALALVLTHFLYRPLDLLWDEALRKITG